MLEPGEVVVSAVSHRDFVLVFGSYGTVLRMVFDHETYMMRVMKEMSLQYQRR